MNSYLDWLAGYRRGRQVANATRVADVLFGFIIGAFTGVAICALITWNVVR
jgi:hypothetical protein